MIEANLQTCMFISSYCRGILLLFYLNCFPNWFPVADDDENFDASSQIPLDDGSPPDYGAIEVIQCLIEHHNAIFTDANETIWRWFLLASFLSEMLRLNRWMFINVLSQPTRWLCKAIWSKPFHPCLLADSSWIQNVFFQEKVQRIVWRSDTNISDFFSGQVCDTTWS